MIGWHYTSEDCWNRIKHEGLIPYRLSHPSLIGQPCPEDGIWLYKERQRGLSHLGCLFWQFENKFSSRLVLLKAQYSKSDIKFSRKSRFLSYYDSVLTLDLKHDLTWGNWIFHTKEPATIAWRPIPPRRIQLVALYDLIELADPNIALPLDITPARSCVHDVQ